MTATALNLNFNKTIILSLLLHASFFLIGWGLSAPETAPLPIGMELNYNEPVAEQKARAQRPKPFPPPVAKDDALTKDVKAAPATIPDSTAPDLNDAAPTATAFSGREGVVNGQEVSAEERYKYELQKLLERRQSYPMMARRMGHQGKVTVRFTIQADGKITDSEVIEKSQYASLNQAALDTVRNLGTTKPFPAEIKKQFWTLTIPFNFELK